MSLRKFYFCLFYGYALIAESLGNEDSSFSAVLALSLSLTLNLVTVACVIGTVGWTGADRLVIENGTAVAVGLMTALGLANFLIGGHNQRFRKKTRGISQRKAKRSALFHTIGSVALFLGGLALIAYTH
jgi:hypothetical protein